MRTLSSVIVLTAALVAAAAPAAGQATGTSSSRQRNPVTSKSTPGPKPKMNIRAFGALDVESMTASKTFNAITGSSVMLDYGGGAEVVNLWKNLFVRADYVTGSSSGDRAFVVGGAAISTGIPITIRISTMEFGGGWRLPFRKHPRYTPYGGAAFLFVHYSETSDLAQPNDDTKNSVTGYSVFGGMDIHLQKRWYLTGEAEYRIVPNAIGDPSVPSVSQLYGETDLGGFVGRVMIGFNLKK